MTVVSGLVPPGTVMVDAGDVPLLAALLREGCRAVGAHRALPPRAAGLLAQVEEAARVSVGGSGVGGRGPHAASSRQQFVSVREGAAVLDRSARRVRQMLAAGELLGVRVGGVWLVDALDLAAVARRRQGRREAS